MQARAIAVRILTRVVVDRVSLSSALAEDSFRKSGLKDRAFVQELCYGVIRWFPALDFIFQQLIERDLRNKDTDIKMLILSGIYQLEYIATPDHAAVSATVEACKDLGKPWAMRLCNAVLRRYLREKDRFGPEMMKCEEAKYAHPKWLLALLREDWPQCWEALVEANNRRPPMYLRINRRQTNRSGYIDLLRNAGIEAEIVPHSDTGLLLPQAVNVDKLPGFEAGLVSVQDLSAQLAAPLLGTTEGQRVLDACAAPGGKTSHILEYQDGLEEVIAVDHDEQRIEMLHANLQRLKLRATIHPGDACRPEDWWDGRSFDRVLVDAPCSATGVIRRHPDIKLLRRKEDITPTTARQYKLLCALWPLLKQGGILLYVTCSVLAQENRNQIERFLREHKDCQINPITESWGYTTPFGTQILTGQDNMDGFFYARLQKT